jgi:hypothetical protein
MDRKKFHERYKDIFGTSTFTETYKAFKALPIEEQNRLKSETLSKARRETWSNPEFKEKMKVSMSNANIDQKKRGEKISQSLKKYYSEHELKNSANTKGVKKSAEQVEKQRASLKKRYEHDDELKKRISDSLKQYYKENGYPHRDKLKKAMQEYFNTPQGIENLEKWTKASKGQGTSKLEQIIKDFVCDIYDGDIMFNVRKVLNDGLELDILMPEKNVAIEINGNIWHSECYKREKAKDCHLRKLQQCQEKNIRLLQFFSDEIENKLDIVKSIIKSSLGIYDKKYYARKLQVRKIEHKQAQEFFENNHLNGNINAPIYYGLFDNDVLVQAISLGKNRFSKSKEIELYRMATLLNTQVVGGFSKLLSHVKKQENITDIMSYVDKRLFDGKGYLSSGWEYVKDTYPNYFYTNGKTRFSRQKFNKQNCLILWPDSDASKTEHQLCYEHNLFRIYDCGNMVMRNHV